MLKSNWLSQLAFLTVTLVGVTATTLSAQELGYKGLNVGMSLYEVNDLVARTDWQWGYRSDGGGRDDPQYDIDESGYGATIYNRSVVGCDDVDTTTICHSPQYCSIRLFNSEVYEVSISGEEYSDSTLNQLVSSLRVFLRAIISKYGDPSVVHNSINEITKPGFVEMLDSTSTSFYEIADWVWVPKSTTSKKKKGKKSSVTQAEPTKQIRVRIYRTHEYGKAKNSVAIDITDLVTEAARDRYYKRTNSSGF